MGKNKERLRRLFLNWDAVPNPEVFKNSVNAALETQVAKTTWVTLLQPSAPQPVLQ